ncbi:DUF4304 domain-containing protein [Flavobacterium johnsoniae]|uniref:DUF4304 domain-containing protein n=1 Tax=Flavobacterium johnsoniae TaxID=986 RepID=UPI0011EE08B3|nr:DUF4304 domain-containing protein [Flavobacterium johnsoniae]
MENKKIQTGKIFGKAAKETGFKGSGVTRYIEFPNYWLLVNHQKSFYSIHFYANVGLIYKELVDHTITEDELKNAFKGKSAIFPHVKFYIERCPEMPDDLTIQIGRAVENGQEERLENVLKESLTKLLSFFEKNYSRQDIRKMYEDKKLSGFVYKDV